MRSASACLLLLLIAGCATPGDDGASDGGPQDVDSTQAAPADDATGATVGPDAQGGAVQAAGPIDIRWAGALEDPWGRACLGPAGCSSGGVWPGYASAAWPLNGSAAAWSHDVTLTWGTGTSPQLYAGIALMQCEADQDPARFECDGLDSWTSAQGTSPIQLVGKHPAGNATHVVLYVESASTGASGVSVSATAGQAFEAVGAVRPA